MAGVEVGSGVEANVEGFVGMRPPEVYHIDLNRLLCSITHVQITSR